MSGLRRQWVLAMMVGELVGFVPPAVMGAALASAGAPDAMLVAGLTAAGCLEGLAIGAAQAAILRRHAAPVDGRAWVAVTSAAAGFAWLVGIGGGALLGAGVLPPAVLLVLLVPAWTAGLLGMGAGQWLVLRRAVPRSGRWVPVTAGAWVAGVALPVAALSAAPNDWPLAAHVVIGVLAAVAMGATVGALTAPTLERLLRQPSLANRTGVLAAAS
jgi:hypothetical protein